jgi:hypothetical protein
VAVLTCAGAITGEADLRRLRKLVTIPVVIAVEAADFLDRVALYNAGAADCLTDQSVTDRLVDSICVLTDWARHPAWAAAGAIAADLHRRGVPVPPIQRRLLAALLSQPGHPLPRSNTAHRGMGHPPRPRGADPPATPRAASAPVVHHRRLGGYWPNPPAINWSHHRRGDPATAWYASAGATQCTDRSGGWYPMYTNSNCCADCSAAR